MTQIKIVDKSTKPNVILMDDLEPCQVGRIVSGIYKGQIVMRTSDSDVHSYLDLSDFTEDSCWGYGTEIRVELLDVEITVTIKGVL